MARPKSDDKKSAILAAATRVIFRQGLSAPTALIAKEANIATGSLFTYFATKAELFNQLYLELKEEMATAALEGLPARADAREQFFHTWSNWMRWAVSHPERRRVLAQLGVSDDITAATRAAGHQTMAGLADLMEQSRAKGPLRDAPMAFVVSILNSLAEATMDFMVQEPRHASKHCKLGFEALWRVLG
jgi:AcrR family transcriptional regulator